jgi:protein TonB
VLTTLTATPAQGPADRAWSASLALHAGLIALAVWWTQLPPRPQGSSHVEPTVVFWPAPRHTVPPPAPDHPAGPLSPAPLVTPTLVSPALPPIETPPTPAWPVTPVDPLPGVPGPAVSVVPGPPSPSPVAPMDVRTVEEPPVLLSHPTPGYPDLLRSAGIQGRVVVEAVLDTLGRVERGSLRIVSSTHALFIPEASALVLGSRYRPARFGGMAVRVRIQVPVGFALRR